MNGEKHFSETEAEEIKLLLIKLRQSNRGTQKNIRNELRHNYSFYISDFTQSKKGFSVEDFNDYVMENKIVIRQ